MFLHGPTRTPSAQGQFHIRERNVNTLAAGIDPTICQDPFSKLYLIRLWKQLIRLKAHDFKGQELGSHKVRLWSRGVPKIVQPTLFLHDGMRLYLFHVSKLTCDHRKGA